MAATLVLSKSLIADAAKRLSALKSGRTGRPGIHSHFTGYLATLQIAHSKGGPATMADITEFLQTFFQPTNASPKRPFLIPWARTGTGWMGHNVAGSYSPGSTRTAGEAEEVALQEVLDVKTKEGRLGWVLRKTHADLAVEKLLGGSKVPALDLAIFLFREYGFTEKEASTQGLLALLQDTLGMAQADFSKVFDTSGALPSDAFEPIKGA